MTAPTRLITDPQLDGVENMARDEALLRSVAAGHSPPTMRVYGWNPPTISLGYFQSFGEFEQLEPPAGDLAVVRRATGGGAILHDCEVTYSVVLPEGHPALGRSPNDLYELMHRDIVDALHATTGMNAEFYRDVVGAAACCGAASACGERTDSAVPAAPRRREEPFFCFARRHALDLVVPRDDGTNDKLCGSAQRRIKGAVLQHGSLIVQRRFEQQPSAEWGASADDSLDLEAAQKLFAAFVGGQAGVERSTHQNGEWTRAELEMAREFRAKYGSDDWLKAR